MERKILYQLKTKDGIKSEIRECDQFMPKIMLAETMALHYSAGEIDPDTSTTYRKRDYHMRRHYVVEFVEYEEA